MATNQIDKQDLKALIMAVIYAGQENPTLSDVDARADVIMGLARPKFEVPLVDLDDDMVRGSAVVKKWRRARAELKARANAHQIGQDDEQQPDQTNFNSLALYAIKAVWLVSDGSQVAFERTYGTPIVYEVLNGKLTQTNSPKVQAGSSLIRVL